MADALATARPAGTRIPRTAFVAILLLFLTVAAFQEVLRFVPANQDDLELLSAASQTSNPLSFLKGYCVEVTGGTLCEYRPLHLFSLWVGYKLFGVSAYPHQLLNLILHFCVILLLLRLIAREQQDDLLVFLLCAVGLVSVYTLSPASWVSDRNTLVVAICLLILVDRFRAGDVRVWQVLALSLIALLSKESGLIVPVFALFAGFRNRKVAGVSCGVILLYFGLRAYLFAGNVAAYGSGGFVLGRPYDNLYDLSPAMRIIAQVEAFAKNLIGTVLPIFNNYGSLSPRSNEISYHNVLIWLPTLVLFVLAINRKPTLMQKLALLIIVLNALVHFKVFRYRVEYMAQLGFCLFVAASPSLLSARRLLVARTAAAVLVLASLVWSNENLRAQWWSRYRELNVNGLSNSVISERGRIDEGIVRQVLGRYKRAD